jgi:predicted nucleic acid-binding protein
MVLLDTTFLSDLVRARPEALRALSELQASGAKLTTSTVNLAELYAGAFRSPDPPRRLATVERLAETLILYDFNARAARVFGELESRLLEQGVVVPAKDLLIAAMGLAHGEHEVLTRNARDFARIPGVTVREY